VECQECRSLYSKVNDTMAVLDDIFEVPEGMTKAILKRKRKGEQTKLRNWNMSGYLQLAAAILFGVFIGHVFGRNTDLTPMVHKHQDPLTTYYKFHHLDIEYSEFDLK